jgi:hypothetical protein
LRVCVAVAKADLEQILRHQLKINPKMNGTHCSAIIYIIKDILQCIEVWAGDCYAYRRKTLLKSTFF